MHSDGILRHVAIAFGIAMAFYVVGFAWFQHERSFRGPWEVTFSTDADGHPSLLVREPYLQITQTIEFPQRKLALTNLSSSERFTEAVDKIPFGKMLFQDPTFLPGTVTMQQFGHEIEFLPRVLIIDKHEIPWNSKPVLVLK